MLQSHTRVTIPARRRHLTVVGARLTLIVAAVVLALLLAEGAVRVVLRPATTASVHADPDDALWADPDWRGPPPRVFRADPILGHAYAPNAVADVRVGEYRGGSFRFRTNTQALRRDDDLTIPKPSGTFRVVVVGDSHTSGYSANWETFPSQLEARLRERAGPRLVEVVNAGVDAYSPQQAYLWHRASGAALGADLVILAIYAGNDMADLAYGGVDGAVVEADAGRVSPVWTPRTWLTLNSELLRRAGPPVTAALAAPVAGVGLQLGPPSLVAHEPLIRLMRDCHGCWFQSYKQAVRARVEPDTLASAYRRAETLFRLLDRRVRDQGGRFAVLLIPTKSQVEPNDDRGAVGRSARLLELTEQDLAYDDVAYQGLLAAADRAGVPALDPLADLHADAPAGRFYYRRDWHLNVNGNRALGAALGRALAAAGLVP